MTFGRVKGEASRLVSCPMRDGQVFVVHRTLVRQAVDTRPLAKKGLWKSCLGDKVIPCKGLDTVKGGGY